jgi:phytoene synthase
LEPSITLNYGATQQNVALRPLHHAHAINPPTSMRVLADLSERLTLPHSLALQPSRAYARSEAYDNLAAHCLSASHKPGPEMLWAYKACTDIIRQHSKSFYFSARLLPAAKRHGIMALYAFCRSSDDLVDNANPHIARQHAAAALDAWAALNSQPTVQADNPVLVAWADTRRRFGIPGTLPEELLNGVRMDLTISRYGTWDDLWLYCYRVASTVGLMSMYITGADTMDAVPYAVQLGVALQLTNILRDVGEDAAAGRIYLPAEDMARFGYTEEMLLGGEINRSFINLMQYEIARARALYAAAWPGIAMLPADSRVAVAAAATVYQGILARIEASAYNVFTHRAHLSMAEKVRALPTIWWSTKRMKRKT